MTIRNFNKGKMNKITKGIMKRGTKREKIHLTKQKIWNYWDMQQRKQ